MKSVYDIAIIGAGPAGIATSCEAVIFGVKKILMFEKGDNHSQTIRKYFNDNKPVDKDWKGIEVELKGHIDFQDGTKESTLDLFEESLGKKLIDAKFNTEISKVSKLKNRFKIETTTGETYFSKRVVVAIGKMGKPNKPDYKIPSSLKLKANHTISDCKGNEDVLVVGGGDSACEYAYFIHQDNRVTFNYRREEITKANPKNVKNLMNCIEDGEIEAKLGVDIEKIEDEDGKFKVFYNDGTIGKYDRIIYALGGVTPKEFLKSCSVSLDENEKPFIDEKNKNSAGVYLAGDICGSIGGSIALALNHGYNIVTDFAEVEVREAISA
ncbi:NAD(P)-binding domain-containing protein [Halarcobacter ebronensis]|uniref:Cbb3-type cytochrome oxidase assembly protein CcoS n=1 Tax=Halarcobacter ebronensis TaxID=1462615 RepID=A0A4Q1AEC2_9BACT|nr:NAD(P)-binding domain-containing protein [Halarcobacter ebronensis]QKF81221.1 NADPH oxidoreductase, putative flavodoxin quinone reductase FqrB [Halarcobacter ebronensis]RXK01784.1 cbb3-type cytochrome oxidase assembly protein CcoS [Halarcobacter ebronensis]